MKSFLSDLGVLSIYLNLSNKNFLKFFVLNFQNKNDIIRLYKINIFI
jgi:hypothetical protein